MIHKSSQMNKGKLSIKDIATQLNISKTTVSFILNGKAKEKRISEQLVEKVLALVKEVGYKPNQLAQSLRTGKTKILGLMVEDISNPFFSAVAKHIETKAYESGYKIIYCSTENDDERAKDFLRMFHNLNVDGYILTPPQGIEEDIQWLVDQGENVILFDRNYKDISTDFVMANNEEGTYNGTQHLIEQGYQNIAFITLSSQQPQMEGRKNGYERAMKDSKLPPFSHAIKFSSSHQDYTKEIKSFLKYNSSLDAILFGTNYLGVSGLEAIATLGLKIPDDLAIVSFDDIDLFRINTPTITAISQPLEKISESIINTLLENMDLKKVNGRRSIEGKFISTNLIVRQSSVKK